jgi:hypothetical protein
MISAKVICDSISPSGVRLTTMQLNYHRFIHAEAKTHRILSLDDEEYEIVLKQDVDLMDDPMLSRNASSSRAIPVAKMIAAVSSSPAMPVHWGKNQAGMQAREEVECPPLAQDVWKYASELAVDRAYELKDLDTHKQIVNRVLEPFQWIKVIVTATEWDNFFKLRLHKDAQPEIQELARCMKTAIDESIPIELHPGEWHLPYVDLNEFDDSGDPISEAIKCSVARCARVSYLNHDNSAPDISKDIALADMLLESGHMSPFEHIATPMDFVKDTFELAWENGVTHKDRDNNFWSGNFRGWVMYRKLLDA